MRLTQLRQADLNLLVVFAALAEERNVSRAAEQLLLSQPAVSRALQRLRETFHDDLLVRGPAGYEPTPLGQRLITELGIMLPRLDRLLTGATFDPNAEEARFRIVATDNASHVVCPAICRTVLPRARKVSFEFVAWHDGAVEALERGRLDLLLNANDGNLPPRFSREVLYEDEFVCVVAKESAHPARLSLRQYLEAEHLGISVFDGRQTIPEQRLADLGHKRKEVIRLPYFSAAIRSVGGTALVATVPRRIAEQYARDKGLRLVGPPRELEGFEYLMAWHPRVESDATHAWLRAMMREVGRALRDA